MNKNKLSNCIKMLNLLKRKGKMKSKELAMELNVSERQIRTYSKNIEDAGVPLCSETGRYGGYYLLDTAIIPELGLEKEEYASLLNAKEFLKNENNFVLLEEYENALDKINIAVKEKEESDPKEYILSDSRPNINLETEKKKYLDISNATTSRIKLKINYFSLKSGLQERIIRPYALFMYKGFYYCIGYCELRNEIRDFKLSRMKEYEIIKENFDMPSDFNIKDYIGKSSIFNSEECDIKLKIKMPMAILVSERIWADNQKITFNEDNSIIFEAKIGLNPELTTWILSMGSCVEVLKPEKLRKEIKEEIGKLKNIYEVL
ncbi:helix-turn-helix transcriptional regulator [Tepidibacter formicigenes]|jgi:predicted DNA-binding transcriptional regulator YafY|uniref:Predicted DNA-binding transcriptional regulator YafY, contains an HTH and WYL domains n=1 Tax=Tepidibacter formicigenes DSM 15518 TaxID=1123349 RepID=A0A1M6TUB9_9FIRM|nr:WYL domain-containing protein [Tepidibacter formicigenes]SHK60490.1 Predicted DNA-binding transcriptional regulator YafY, contains an HTH and WYL domains [Tepidibacter formicigenes DSM 15518]